jgi:hypothetical protein
MITAFQIILLIIMVIGFMGVVAEKNKENRAQVLAVTFASMAAFMVSVVWL